MLNHITIQGRLCADPEARQTQRGDSVVNFRIACDRNYTGSDGQRGADFFRATAFKNIAEFIRKYFRKGDQILLVGELVNNNYTNKDGVQVNSNEISVLSAYFCESRRKSNEGQTDGGQRSNEGQSQTEAAAPPMQSNASSGFAEVLDDDDIPF